MIPIVLKLSEEIRLSDISETQVFRIYALTGRFILIPTYLLSAIFCSKHLTDSLYKLGRRFSYQVVVRLMLLDVHCSG